VRRLIALKNVFDFVQIVSLVLLSGALVVALYIRFGRVDGATQKLQEKAARGAQLYAQHGCEKCHGAGGAEASLPSYPRLAGQNAEYLLTQMQDIKAGRRNNSLSALMQAQVGPISNKEMAAIAFYLETQR